jgi:hypothetical protein
MLAATEIPPEMVSAYALLFTVGIGVLAGVIVNACTWVFHRQLLPAYQDWKYEGMRIDGQWVLQHIGKAADGRNLESTTMSASLIQKAHSIQGSATAILDGKADAREIVVYKVTGEIRDRFVTLYLRAADRRRIAHSSFLLEVVGDGGRMEGTRAFYGLKQQAVRAIECAWTTHYETGGNSDCRTM